MDKPWNVPVDAAQYDALFALTSPLLYRENAFRITQMPVDASDKDITRRKKAIEQAVTMGMTVPGSSPVFPLEVDQSTFDKAIVRLLDPEQRILQELFWFWPLQRGNSANDSVLQTLAEGNIIGAQNMWVQAEQRGNPDGVAAHNLAILAHASALEWEYVSLTRALAPAETHVRDIAWGDAMRYWHRALANEAIWRQMGQSIRDMNDPRVTELLVQRVRSTLPTGLLAINATLAFRQAEKHNGTDCERHKQIIQRSAFGANEREAALRRAVQPVRERLRTLGEHADKESETDPIHADRTASTFLDQALPLLAALDWLFPAGDPIRDGLHDQVTQDALGCIVDFGQKTEQWSIVLTLLDRIAALPASEPVRVRLRENREASQNNYDASRLGDIADQLKALFDNAIKRAEADPPHADRVVVQLLDQVTPIVARVDATLPAGHEVRTVVHDQVAQVALSCLIDYANATDQWDATLTLLQRITPFAVSAEVRKRMSEAQQKVTDNRSASLCFFCKKRQAVPSASKKLSMYGNVARGYNSVRYSTATATIPRCTICQQRHAKAANASGIGCGIGLLVAIVAGIIGYNVGDGGGAVIGVIATLIIASIIANAVGHSPLKSTDTVAKTVRISALVAL